MKKPERKEEYLVWPPIGGGIAAFIGMTGFDVFEQYHKLIIAQDGAALYAGYFFPIAMALGFSSRLHGKYWLGFAWVGLLFYFMAWMLSFFALEGGIIATLLMISVCSVIMLAAQASCLYMKRRWWRSDSSDV